MLSERQIQYTLLENSQLLAEILGLQSNLIAAYLNLSPWGYIGEIDFVIETPSKDIWIVELEKEIANQAKVEHVVEQVERYARAGIVIYGPQVFMVVLAAQSPEKYLVQIRKRLAASLSKLNISHKIVLYDIASVLTAYQELQSRDERVFGWFVDSLAIRSVASLGQLNEIFYHFKVRNLEALSRGELEENVTWKRSSTLSDRLMVCYELGLLEDPKLSEISLTSEGIEFRNYLNYPYRLSGGKYLDLSEPQKRILRHNIIRIVRETGAIENHLLAQMICFLQFVTLMGGKYIVLSPSDRLPEDVQAMLARIVRKTSGFGWKRASGFIAWTQKYCANLDLIYLVQDGSFYRALFTDTGARFYRLLSDQLNILREEATLRME